MYVKALAIALVGIFVLTGVSQAQMTSPNFQIRWDTISAGGSDTASSASYGLRDSVSPLAGSQSSSASFKLDSGYRPGIFDEIITFDPLVQSTSSVRATTGYAGNVITASSAGVIVGDYVALVQDRGTSQISGIGRVTAVGGATITIDTLATGGVGPIIDGANDYVYVLSGGALAFGDLSAASVGTGIIGFEVTADNSNGYSVQILEDGNLRNGGDAISDVADGTVTVGSAEYGARSSDTTIATTTFDTQDSAITTTAQAIATSSVASYDQRMFITVKAAISGASVAGAYGQTLTLIASGNF